MVIRFCERSALYIKLTVILSCIFHAGAVVGVFYATQLALRREAPKLITNVMIINPASGGSKSEGWKNKENKAVIKPQPKPVITPKPAPVKPPEPKKEEKKPAATPKPIEKKAEPKKTDKKVQPKPEQKLMNKETEKPVKSTPIPEEPAAPEPAQPAGPPVTIPGKAVNPMLAQNGDQAQGPPGPPGPITFGTGTGQLLTIPEYYVANARLMIMSNFSIPSYLKNSTAICKASFIVNREGKISNAKIEQTSGNTVLDQVAIKAIEYTESLAPLPDEIKGDVLQIFVTFDFKYFE